MSDANDNVTGYGVPLTTAERVRKYGERTRPTLGGKTPDFELDSSLEATYRETVLLGYEDIDGRAKKVLSDERSWRWFQVIAAAFVPLMWVLFATSSVGLAMAIVGSAAGVLIVILGFGYRRLEMGKHADIVEEAGEYLKAFVAADKARLL